MINEEDLKRNQLGVRDIRSFMGVGKRKAGEELGDKLDKKAKVVGKEMSREKEPTAPAGLEPKPESEPESEPESWTGTGTLDLESMSDIFAGITIFISGSTLPQISEYKLKHLLASNGARTSIYMARKTVTHVIVGQPNTGCSGAGGGLSARKLQQEIARGGWKGVKVVSVDWYVLLKFRIRWRED